MIRDISWKGRTIRCIEDEKLHTAHSYVTLNSWHDNNRLVVLRLPTLSGMGRLVSVDIETGKEELLEVYTDIESYTISNEKIFFRPNKKTVIAHDLGTGTRKVICYLEEDAAYTGWGLTNDGKTLSLSYKRSSGENVIITANTDTGETTHIKDIVFPHGHNDVSHCMINPERTEQIFFCHEGVTGYITNRLWMITDGEPRNILRQKMDENGNLAQQCGHEMWDYEGNGLFFITYPQSTIEKTGVWYIDAKTFAARHVAGAFPYWHVGVSRGGNLLMADCTPINEMSDVVLIDQKKGTEEVVFSAGCNWVHPTHPHPNFSPDDKFCCFSFLNEIGKLCIGCIEVC